VRDYKSKSKAVWADGWNKVISPIIAKEHKRLGLEDDDEPLICVDYVVMGAYEWAFPMWKRQCRSTDSFATNADEFAELLKHYIEGNGR